MMRRFRASLHIVVLMIYSTPALAQDEVVAEPPSAEADTEAVEESEAPEPEAPATPSGPPKTMPSDVGFGERGVSASYHFPDQSRFRPRVDRRDEIDASSDRTILWPTAHTPHKHTLAVSNHMLLLSQISYSPTDDAQLTASVVVPFDVADTHIGLSGKLTLNEGPNHTFSIAPFGQYRRSSRELANSDFGLGAAALLDIKSSNNIILSFGAVAYATVLAVTGVYTYDDCESRQDFIDGSCRDTSGESNTFPSGGHFVAGQVGITWYILDSWSLRGEVMTGVAAGSVLGSEWISRQVDPSDETERFETGRLGTGFPYDTDITVGGGLQWSNGLIAVQMSGYVLTAPEIFDPEFRSIYFVPMANLGIALF